jgi:hypothetical protein
VRRPGAPAAPRASARACCSPGSTGRAQCKPCACGVCWWPAACSLERTSQLHRWDVVRGRPAYVLRVLSGAKARGLSGSCLVWVLWRSVAPGGVRARRLSAAGDRARVAHTHAHAPLAWQLPVGGWVRRAAYHSVSSCWYPLDLFACLHSPWPALAASMCLVHGGMSSVCAHARVLWVVLP